MVFLLFSVNSFAQGSNYWTEKQIFYKEMKNKELISESEFNQISLYIFSPFEKIESISLDQAKTQWVDTLIKNRFINLKTGENIKKELISPTDHLIMINPSLNMVK